MAQRPYNIRLLGYFELKGKALLPNHETLNPKLPNPEALNRKTRTSTEHLDDKPLHDAALLVMIDDPAQILVPRGYSGLRFTGFDRV